MFRKLIGIVLTMTMFAVFSQGNAWAVTTGTADGTYDFGGLGLSDSFGPGTGYAKLGDKFKVGNDEFGDWYSINDSTKVPRTAITTTSANALTFSAVIKAEGGSVCKTFTFKDLGISAFVDLQQFASFDIVLKDINNAPIGTPISLGGSPVFSSTAITNISTLYSRVPWAIDNVASIEITFSLLENGIPTEAWNLNFENITIANVSNLPAAPAIFGVSPSSGSTTGGTLVTITGADFTAGAAVTFGSFDAINPVVVSSTQITATTPTAPEYLTPKTVDITVAASAGKATNRFTYNNATGTVDGIYDFGSLGATDSFGAGSGFAKLGDKFKVDNDMFVEWQSLNNGPITAIYPWLNSLSSHKAVIKAEGGSTCNTYTFKDLGISFYNSTQKFGSLAIKFISADGHQIGSDILLAGSPVYAKKSDGSQDVTQISALTNPPGPWAIADVADITIDYTVINADGSLASAWDLNLENITVANVVGKSFQSISFAPVPPIGIGGTGPLVAVATSALPVDFTSTTPTVCTVTGTTVKIDNPGSCIIAANQGGNAFYFPADPVMQNFSKASQTISFGAVPTVTVGGSGTVSALATSGLTSITFSSVTPAVCSVSGTIVTGIKAGTCKVAANLGEDAVYNAAPQVVQVIIVAKGSQTISFGTAPIINYGGTGAVTVSVTSRLAPLLSSLSPTVCSVSGTTVTGINVGSCIIAANQGGDTNYNPATQVTQTINIDLAGQTINFGTAPTVVVGGTGTVIATATSNLTPTLSSSTPAVCSILGTTVTGVTSGDCIITASQTGNSSYKPALPVTQNINIGKGSQTLSFGAAPTVNVGTTGTVGATASSGLAVALTTMTPAVCTISGTTVTGVAFGTCTIAANQSGDINYSPATQVPQSFNVGKGPQAIGFGAVPTVIVGGTGVVSAAASSGLTPVSFISTTPGVCTISGTTVTGVTAGTCTIAADQAGNINYNAAVQVMQNFTIGKGNQSISFGTAPTISFGGTGTVSASSDKGLTPVIFSSLSPACSISGTIVTGVTAGNCTIAADQAGNSDFNLAAQVTQIFSIGKAAQTVSFDAAPTVAVGNTGTVSATATSTLVPVYSSMTPTVCTISGAIVTGVSVGTCIIAANQSGDSNYYPALQATQNINVSIGSQSIIFGAAPIVTVGATGTVSATASSGLTPVIFNTTTPAVCTINGAIITGVTAGTCTITANQAGTVNYNPAAQVTQNITIGKGNQAIVFGTAPSIVVSTTGAVSATASSGLTPVTFSSTTPAVCSISGSVVFSITAGTCIIAADQAGNANYNAAAQATLPFTVGMAPQTISFGSAPTIVVGGTGTVSATATSAQTPVFTSTTPSICTISGSTVTGVTVGACIIAANQNGDVNFNPAAQVTQSIPIGIGSQAISFGAAPSVAVGGTGTVSATANSGLIPVTFATTTAAVCSISGTTVTGLTSGPCIITADQAGSADYNPAVQVTLNFNVGKGSQAISFGIAPDINVGGTGSVSASASTGLTPVIFNSATPSVCSVSGTTVTGLTAGTCTITADQAGNANYNQAIQVIQNFGIGKGTQLISFGAVPAVGVGSTGTVSATANSGLTPVAFSTSTPAICRIAGTTVTGITFGNCIIAANQDGDSNYYPAAQVTQAIAIGKGSQTITFGAAPVVNVSSTGTVSATANSGLTPVTFSSKTPAVCSVSGTTVTGITVGICTIAADQSGDSNFNPAVQVIQSISIGKGSQAITFGTAPVVNVNGSGTVGATADSGLSPVTFSSTTPAVCTVSGSTVSGITAGTCTITADQSGNGNYNPAVQVTQSFGIGKGSQTISFGTAPTVNVGSSGMVSATATANLTPVFSSTTPSVCSISGTLVTGITSGTCTIVANQNGNADYNPALQVAQSFVVKTNQTITFVKPGDQIFARNLELSASATSLLLPTFSSSTPDVCAISTIATVTFATFKATGVCTISADQAGNSAYNAAPRVTQSFTVNKATQSITFTNPGEKTFGTNPTLSATASSGLLPSFSSSTSSVCTITAGGTLTFVASGYCVINADQKGDLNYDAAPQVSQRFKVNTASQAILFTNPGAQTFGTIPPLVATASSGLALSFSSTTSGVCTITPEGILSFVTSGTCTVAADQAGNASYNAAAQVAQSFLVNKGSQTITFANPGDQSYGTNPTLSATVSSGLALDYSSTTTGICTITAGGTLTFVSLGDCIINVAQSGNANYNAAPPIAQTFKVIKGNQTITFVATPAIIVGGTGTLVASATSGQPVTFTSETPAVCTVNTATVTRFTTGTCIILADQAGDANYNAATQVKQNIDDIIVPIVPIVLSDALSAYQIFMGLKKNPTAAELARFDVAPLGTNGKPKGNSVIDIGDVVLMLRNLVGLVNF